MQANGDLSAFTDNVGKVSTSGAELEMTWLPAIEGLMFGFNVGYLDSEVKEYLTTDENGNSTDIADTTALGFAPLWSLQDRFQYDINIGAMGWLTLGADGSCRTESYTYSPIDLTSATETQQVQDEHVIWNAMMAWRSPRENWRVALEGKNLAYTRVLTNTYVVGPIVTGGYNMPRTWALSAAYRF